MDAEFALPFDFADIRLLQELIETAARASGLTDGEIFVTKLAVEEALVSALKHGTPIRPALEIALNAVRRDGQTDRPA